MDSEDHEILNRIYFSQDCHERETLRHLTLLLGRRALFVDVGASYGQYVYHASRFLRDSTIIAIEAEPDRYKVLVENCAKWEKASGNRILPVHAAACDRPGEVEFYSTGTNVSGSILRHDFEGYVKGLKADEHHHRPASFHLRKFSVPAVTLDEMCSSQVPDLVKVDVEGAEFNVLQGASQLLQAGKTLFLVEIDERGSSGALRDLLDRHGYRSMSFFDNTLFYTERGLGRFRRLVIKIRRMLSEPRAAWRSVARRAGFGRTGSR